MPRMHFAFPRIPWDEKSGALEHGLRYTTKLATIGKKQFIKME